LIGISLLRTILKRRKFCSWNGYLCTRIKCICKIYRIRRQKYFVRLCWIRWSTGNITTYHVKTVDYLIKQAPSLGFER